MTTAAELVALAERCERGEVGFDIDKAILRALGYTWRGMAYWYRDDSHTWGKPSEFTQSCDSADTLRPTGMAIVITLADKWIAQMDGGAHVGIADTEAAARTAAALRARAAMVTA